MDATTKSIDHSSVLAHESDEAIKKVVALIDKAAAQMHEAAQKVGELMAQMQVLLDLMGKMKE